MADFLRLKSTYDNNSRSAALLLLFRLSAAVLIACRAAIAAPTICTEYGDDLSDDIGEAITISESDTWCDAVTGVVHYSWTVQPHILLYRQIDIRCYNRNYSGDWVIAQERSSNASDGSASYPVPPHLLNNDITITSCIVHSCYNKYGFFTVYLTNSVTVNCTLPADSVTTSVISSSDSSYFILPSNTVLVSPSLTLLQESTPRLTSTVTSSFRLSSSPVQRGHSTGGQGTSLSLYITIPLIAMIVIVSLIIITMAIICHNTLSRTNRGVIDGLIFKEKKFDPSLQPPPLTLLSLKMNTPYHSQYSIICDTDQPDLSSNDGNHGYDVTSAQKALSLSSESCTSDPRVLLGEISDQSPPTSDNTTHRDDMKIDSPKIEGTIGNDTALRMRAHIDSANKVTTEIPVAMATTDHHHTVVDSEIRVKDDNSFDGLENNDCEELTNHFNFDFSSISTKAFVDPLQSSWKHYQMTSSSGYVTDSSALLSPISLEGTPTTCGSQQQQVWEIQQYKTTPETCHSTTHLQKFTLERFNTSTSSDHNSSKAPSHAQCKETNSTGTMSATSGSRHDNSTVKVNDVNAQCSGVANMLFDIDNVQDRNSISRPSVLQQENGQILHGDNTHCDSLSCGDKNEPFATAVKSHTVTSNIDNDSEGYIQSCT